MSRTFAYVRVSTTEPTTDNQRQEIERAGFTVEPRRIITETVSGSSAIDQRKGFLQLMEKLEPDDVLIVTKLDRLGRNAMDVQATVKKLAAAGVRVHCLQLGGADLTSSAGKMVMGMLATFAEFERDLLIERTQAGLQRAKVAGKALGRPLALSDTQKSSARTLLGAGASVSAIARQMKCSRMTIMRLREAARGAPT